MPDSSVLDKNSINPSSYLGHSKVNWVGLKTLIQKEVGRFINVYTQTIIAPVVTTLLFYAVFSLAFGELRRDVGDVSYMEFLAPGLLMMGMLQNAFANSSSSIVISKVQGNIVDVLMPPLSPLELFIGYVSGSAFRGLLVGLVTGIAVSFIISVSIHSLSIIILFAVLGNIMMGSLGLVAGLWSEKFDHIAAVTNFIVMPLTFLSGTFYSISQLPEMWQKIAVFNPFFYVIDGFRYGFIAQADSNIFIGIGLLLAVNLLLAWVALKMFKTGYKIKS